MKTLALLLATLLLAGCSALPEQGPARQRLSGQLTFPEATALPPSATAHVTVVPALAAEAKPIAQGDFPARTGTAIPFELEFLAEKVASGGEYLVFAQIVDHGRVWYSNLHAPLRLSFTAEPGEVLIPLRAEPR